ncbi:UNVERIFIED_CONTAM: hypothetical protein PYX00_010072 [Menopon gallinae]|uniref:PIPK domain-containing protein n=1 Tax=Menopon gallinae TaxID=328185 RepID=A0AAW2HDX2_9NEOP
MATGASVEENIIVEESSVNAYSRSGKGDSGEELRDDEEKEKQRGKKPPPLDMTSAGDANGSGPKTPTSISKIAEKERKIGHRRVGVGGEITYKKIQTTQIMGSIQLGIQHAVGGLASKPERDLLMQDFMTVETCNFPTMGSNHTPAHHFVEFKFKNYAPIAFRYFRDLFGIQPDDFLMSMCSAPLRELSNPGASGSIFYLTEDDEFIIKTVQHKEGEFLQKLLPGYYMNLNQNPRTLLPKFFGLYCYQCNSKNVRLVAMNNLLPSSVKLHQKYDLKGSTYKRKASKIEKAKQSPTFKDLDFMEHHPEGIFLEADTYSALVKTIQRDCRVLESFKIMDYSLLVGIHNLDQCAREKLEKSTLGSNENFDSLELGQPDSLERGESHEAGSTALNRSKSINRQRLVAHSTAMESIQAASEPIDQQDDIPPGGIPARNAKGERLLLFLGIIDILQSYRLKKKLEHTWKAMIHDGDTVSVHRPGFYAQRFQDFMAKTVFKKIPSLDLPEIKGNHRKFRTLVTSYIALKHSPSKRKSISRAARPSEPDVELGNENKTSNNSRPESPHSYEITTTAMVSAMSSNQSSSSGMSNNQNQNSNKTTHQNSNKVANPSHNKTSPPKVSPASPESSNSLLYPAVLGRGAAPLQKSRVPPPVPPRGSPKPKRDMPANRGFANSCSGIPSCSTPPPAFEDAVRGDTPPRHRNPHHIRSYREETVSISEVRLDHKSSLSVESSSSTSGFTTGTSRNLTWTPPASVEGSTPTWTEGTPSFTESSSSGDIGCPTTPIKSSHHRRNSSGPKSLTDDSEHSSEMVSKYITRIVVDSN